MSRLYGPRFGGNVITNLFHVPWLRSNLGMKILAGLCHKCIYLIFVTVKLPSSENVF